MAAIAKPMRQINIKVSEKVFANIEKLAKVGGIPVTAMAGYLFDAAYSARMSSTPDADLDAHVALVGLATMGGGIPRPARDRHGTSGQDDHAHAGRLEARAARTEAR